MSPTRRLLLVLALAAAGAGAALGSAPASTSAPNLRKGAVVIDTTLGYQGSGAAGTGIVIGAGGVVLTNNHVIRGATAIRVVDPRTGRGYAATVAGYDIAEDVAVLKLTSGAGLATATLASSATLRRGQAVTAVGNAGGTGRLVVAPGRITGLNRAIAVQDDQGGTERLRGLIQTDADLQPGDSGGPLLDRSGRVIGVDTAASVGFAFVSGPSDGYAIPIARALGIARQIQAGRGSATVHVGPTAFLGVSVQTASDAAGALVAQVVPGGPADQAGVAAGDLITAIDGQAVSSPASIVPLLQTRKPGDTVELTVVDELGSQTTKDVQLGSGPPQ